MGALYESLEETTTRLNGTVFLYKNQPVYCGSVGFAPNGVDITLACTFYPTGSDSAILRLDDPDLEFYRFNIGYLNLQDGATFMTRIPAKGQFKQGLYKNNTRFTPIGKAGSFNGQYRPEFGGVFKTPGFRDMLVGKYPKFREAVDRLTAESGPPSVAFDRNFAVSFDEFRKDVLLHYKGERIGFGSDEFQVPVEFSYLREVIDKSGIKVK